MVQRSRDPDDLRRALVARPDRFVQAFTENLLTYALGRSVEYTDMPAVRSIVRRAAADDYRFESIVLGIISSDAFRKREAPERKLPHRSRREDKEEEMVNSPQLGGNRHVSHPKTLVATHPAERRRRFDRLAAAGCHDPGGYGARANCRRSAAAPGLRLLSARRPSG